MTPLRAFSPILLLAAVAATTAAPVAAAPAPAPAGEADGACLASPPAGIRAGDVLELSWSELPAGIDECEILLSLDDGRTWPVRVSPELERAERRYRWRVPNLPSPTARLRLRLGGARGERLAPVSAAFRIEGSAAAGPPDDILREGTLWIGLGPVRGGGDAMLGTHRDALSAGDASRPVVLPPRAPAARSPLVVRAGAPLTLVLATRSGRLARDHRPVIVPLRI